MDEPIKILRREFAVKISFTVDEITNPKPIDWDKFWADYYRLDLIEEEIKRIRRNENLPNTY